MNDEIEEGYRYGLEHAGAQIGVNSAHEYIQNVNSAINEFAKDINSFCGYSTKDGQLQGDLAEFWHGKTFNINAALNSSQYAADVFRSHNFASPDIKTNWDEDYGLKYYRSATGSVKAQSTTYFERFSQFKSQSNHPDLSFEEYVRIKGISEDAILSDPIYSGQMRVIPTDQLETAKEYLRFKIAKELLTRPEQAKRYQDTLDYLTDKIKAPDGTHSVELTREQAEELARLAKVGDFAPENWGFSTEQLIKLTHILNRGIEAGTTAAVISMVIKIAPEIFKCLENLISTRRLKENDLKNVGFAALEGSGEGFLRGFVAASITTCCESGILGNCLKTLDPSIIGALTVIVMNTMRNSFLVVKGSLSKNELAANLSRNIFVAAFGVGGGMLLQTFASFIPLAYLLGNFVGSFVGSFAYIAYEKAFLSFCIHNGWTMFGLVEQNYELPKEIIDQLGFDVLELEKYIPQRFNENRYAFKEYVPQEPNHNQVKMVRRGVIGIWQVGYITS